MFRYLIWLESTSMGRYRPNAGIVVFRDDGKVLLCERFEKGLKRWQFPQGGIDVGETPLQAATRELREETSLVSVKFISSIDEPLRYTFPPEVKALLAKKNIHDDGQEQYWHLFHLEGNETEINLNTDVPEFRSYEWVDILTAPDRVVSFKYQNYKIVSREFSKRIKEYLCK